MRARRVGVRVAAAAAGLLMAMPAFAGFLERTLELDGRVHRYQVYVPDSLATIAHLPVVLSLHGTGERGDDGRLPTTMGLGPAIRAHPERFPLIAVFPQAPRDAWWQGSTADLALATLDRAIDEFGCDTNRVYLTGASMGGTGAWYIAARHPERFAALVVICGRIAPDRVHATAEPIAPPGSGAPEQWIANQLKDLPIRLFHGDDDPVVPVDNSRRMNRALGRLGADVRYVELPGVGHGAWEAAWRDSALVDWLIGNARSGRRKHTRSRDRPTNR